MVKHTELKPPAELVDAIKSSEDASTAPASAVIPSGPGGFSGSTPRVIRNALEHEEPQRPSLMADAHGSAGGERAVAGREERREERKELDMEHTAGHGFKGQRYDRDHVVAADQASIMSHARKQ
ncbi:hypothetical protein MNEG_7190 [Monoraphidium neglectum]|uniref:Uncharacterized protein n=1 Tax=Monoraphidium neglectum TaxID=145388 RepID=A0A0D2MJH9_9CHLO|nr:hypothetical protein MNEG_7190 [Monoraphidium neglectum]KIZ00772.1 hypothetical protein MNEG_7190 [Monoraphidium neglectum]|eukprot:XP_013899791.1 hypothetical protein MNEG_7190 [Monoraphidium neglectum]